MVHKSVLLQQSIEGLEIKKGDVFIDATLGNGGHSEYVCDKFGDSVHIIGIDLDKDAIERTKKRIQGKKCNIDFVESNFADIDVVLNRLKIDRTDKILFDLGMSSNQLEDSGRGFTFQKDEPLLMTFKKEPTEDDITAKEIVNFWDEENIEIILEAYGEERFAERIAKKIAEERKNKTIETTFDLVKIIESAVPAFYRRMKINPATKTFQALRIAVNNEFESLKKGLRTGFEILNSGGRMAVIAFHSLEDREVKRYFRELNKEGIAKIITKKPIVPTREEIKENPRSRSSKLRIIEKN